MVVHNDQRLGITIEGRGTTQAHGHTGTEVTGVGHDVKTGNLSLQGLVDRFEGQTFEVVHLHAGNGTGVFALRNVKTRGGSLFLGYDFHLLHLLYSLSHIDLIDCLVDLEGLVLVTHAMEDKFVFLVLHNHGEVTVGIGDGTADDTVVRVHLLDLNARNAAELVTDRTAYAVDLCTDWQCEKSHCPKQ